MSMSIQRKFSKNSFYFFFSVSNANKKSYLDLYFAINLPQLQENQKVTALT